MFRFPEEQQKKTRTKAHKRRERKEVRVTLESPQGYPDTKDGPKSEEKVNSKAHHGPKQDPVKSELPRTTNTDTRAHKVTGGEPSQN